MNVARPARPIPVLLAVVVGAVVTLAACSGSGAAPSAGPSQPPATVAPPDTPVTGAPSDPGTAPDPGPVGGQPVVAKPGQLDVHPVAADSLDARVDGDTIIVTATWTSGVEPCYVLDSVGVSKGEGTYTITLREGHGPGDVVCIEIAEVHRTVVEIPDVAPGTWTIADSGGVAAPVVVTVG
jgi:hypothetical protein